MRNVFDQYSQPENRLTHALAVTLHEDPRILASFLRWVGASDAPKPERLRILEQRLPGEEIDGVELTESESRRRGLPDICIFDEDSETPWALLVESKVQAKIAVDQLLRHQQTVARRGFKRPRVLVVAIDAPPESLPPDVVTRQWREVYAWLRAEHPSSRWSRTMTAYMEIFETKMVPEEYGIRGTITMFDGLRFGPEKPYTYPEAKRLLRLLTQELRKQRRLEEVGVDLSGEGRGAITGSGRDSVWDFLPLRGSAGSDVFTAHPHFTISIGDSRASIQLSVPHGVKNGFSKRLAALGADGFAGVILELEKNLREVIARSAGAKPYVHAIQRHWPSRSAPSVEDAKLTFDPRTVVPGGRDGVKYQPEWCEGVFRAVLQKRSNLALAFGLSISYDCDVVGSPKVVDLLIDACLAMRPAVELAAPDALPRALRVAKGR